MTDVVATLIIAAVSWYIYKRLPAWMAMRYGRIALAILLGTAVAGTSVKLITYCTGVLVGRIPPPF